MMGCTAEIGNRHSVCTPWAEPQSPTNPRLTRYTHNGTDLFSCLDTRQQESSAAPGPEDANVAAQAATVTALAANVAALAATVTALATNVAALAATITALAANVAALATNVTALAANVAALAATVTALAAIAATLAATVTAPADNTASPAANSLAVARTSHPVGLRRSHLSCCRLQMQPSHRMAASQKLPPSAEEDQCCQLVDCLAV
jgi:hypothetical protein